MSRSNPRLYITLLCFLLGSSTSAVADGVTELFTTTPLIVNDILYVGSVEASGHGGHLRAYALDAPSPVLLWDAAARIPLAGTGADPGLLFDSDPPSGPAKENLYRSVFTNLDEVSVPLTAAASSRLRSALGVDTAAAAEALINRLRGRTGVTAALPAGTGEAPARLWGISASPPVLIGPSTFLAAASRRDRVVYVGAEDGLLHAFYAGEATASTTDLRADSALGTELWAYLPGTFLGDLHDQPFDDPAGEVAIHLDGTLQGEDFFLDLNGDGLREWRTLLAGSGSSLSRARSSLFVVDVTDPYRPQLLWEQPLTDSGTGRTRGPAWERAAHGGRLFVTTRYVEAGTAGIQACAFGLVDGRVRWRFRQTLPSAAPTGPVPAVPVVFAGLVSDRQHLVFGDQAGRLWALDTETGKPFGGGPVFTTDDGPRAIGRVVIDGRLAFFAATPPAADGTARTVQVYCVALTPEGGRLLWSYALDAGEQVHDGPVLDDYGHLFLGTARGWVAGRPAAEQQTTGRTVILDREGRVSQTVDLDDAQVGGTALGIGMSVSVSLTGTAVRLGSGLSTPDRAGIVPARLSLRAWRRL